MGTRGARQPSALRHGKADGRLEDRLPAGKRRSGFTRRQGGEGYHGSGAALTPGSKWAGEDARQPSYDL